MTTAAFATGAALRVGCAARGAATGRPRVRCCAAPARRAELTATRLQDAASAAPGALEAGGVRARAGKYIFPMRADNTQVFFDHASCDDRTLMVVFAEPHHGLFLDVLSVLKALGVKCWRIASSESDTTKLLMNRIEGELVSMSGLNLNTGSCSAFWITDEASGDRIMDDVDRLDQITACIKLELDRPNPRPTPACGDCWHRVTVEASRGGRSSVFSVQSADRPALLQELSAAFVASGLNVGSAAIQTFGSRVENTFFVTSAAGAPLTFDEIEDANEEIMRALLRVGVVGDGETLWYQKRHGSAIFVAEAVFIDDVCNKTLSTFARMETPNFRGRLPDAPYRPVSLQ